MVGTYVQIWCRNVIGEERGPPEKAVFLTHFLVNLSLHTGVQASWVVLPQVNSGGGSSRWHDFNAETRHGS